MKEYKKREPRELTRRKGLVDREYVKLAEAAAELKINARRISGNPELFEYLAPKMAGGHWMVRRDRVGMAKAILEGWIDGIEAAKRLKLASRKFHSQRWILSKVKQTYLFGRRFFDEADIDAFTSIVKKLS